MLFGRVCPFPLVNNSLARRAKHVHWCNLAIILCVVHELSSCKSIIKYAIEEQLINYLQYLQDALKNNVNVTALNRYLFNVLLFCDLFFYSGVGKRNCFKCHGYSKEFLGNYKHKNSFNTCNRLIEIHKTIIDLRWAMHMKDNFFANKRLNGI